MEKLREESRNLIIDIEHKVSQELTKKDKELDDYGFISNFKALSICKEMYKDAVNKDKSVDLIKDALVYFEMEEDRIVKNIMDSEDSLMEIKNMLKDE